jgi:hypothetical protein
MSSIQLYPEVIDKTNVAPIYSTSLFLPVGVEGQMDNAGTGTVGQPYVISSPSQSDTYFGPSSALSAMIKFYLKRGVPQAVAVASKKGSSPILSERQAAWQVLESNPRVRIRATDSTVQADLVGLAGSCDNADKLFNKQIAFGGMATGTAKSALISAATAIASKRFVLVGPAIYDDNGVLLSGGFAAAAVAAEVSRNSDIADDLDLLPLNGLTGIEVSGTGVPVFTRKVVSGSVVNDFEDLLQGGVSPLQINDAGTGVQLTHLRTTYTVDGTFDALMTRLIVDQIFIDVRDYLRTNNFLRRGNTVQTRADIQAGVEALLSERSSWIRPLTLPDGTTGYKVAVTSSPDNRQVIVSYQGVVIRGIQTIVIDDTLSVPV